MQRRGHTNDRLDEPMVLEGLPHGGLTHDKVREVALVLYRDSDDCDEARGEDARDGKKGDVREPLERPGNS